MSKLQHTWSHCIETTVQNTIEFTFQSYKIIVPNKLSLSIPRQNEKKPKGVTQGNSVNQIIIISLTYNNHRLKNVFLGYA